MTSNNPILLRFNVATGTFLAPIDIPDSNAVAGDMAVHGDDIWFTDFNNQSLWRYNITAGAIHAVPPPNPTFRRRHRRRRQRMVHRPVRRTPSTDSTLRQAPSSRSPSRTGSARGQITIATDGQIWFTSRFVPQGVGRLDPTTGVVTTFPTPSNPGPEGIAASPDGSVWFTQTTKGNIARIDNSGVITEAKAVKGSEPFGITVAPNGDPWYTMMAANKIATLQLR